jgi:hypothetical protein
MHNHAYIRELHSMESFTRIHLHSIIGGELLGMMRSLIFHSNIEEREAARLINRIG